MPRTFNPAQKTVMFVGAAMIIVGAVMFAVIASVFTPATFAALFFLMLVPVIATGLLIYYSDAAAANRALKLYVYTAGVLYYLVGSGLAVVFLLIPFRPGILFVLELLLLILLGGFIVLLGHSMKGIMVEEAAQMRRVEQVVSLESRIAALRSQAGPGSPEALGLDRVIDEVRYFDKNAYSQYDRPILEKLLDLESVMLTRGAPPAPPGPGGQAPLLDMGAQGGPAEALPPPVTDPPLKLIEDLHRLAVARHQGSPRTKRGGF
jgi:hypothetical protein